LNLAIKELSADKFKDNLFSNSLKDKLNEKHLRLTTKTFLAHSKLNEQPGDFWVFPFQFGASHWGSSVRRARANFKQIEFGLGVYEVAILLITHPDRLQRKTINIDCAGVELTLKPNNDFCYCPAFSYGDGRKGALSLISGKASDAAENFGSASGFLPQ